MVDFIYWFDLVVELIGNWLENECDKLVMYQVRKYKVIIKVVEFYFQGEICFLEEAEIIIKNVIVDLVQLDIVMVDGELKYDFIVGDFVFNDVYEKNLEVMVEVEFRYLVLNILKVFVMGKRQCELIFILIMFEIFFMVLYDFFGDGSYVYIEEGSMYCFDIVFEMIKEININNKLIFKKGFLNFIIMGLGVVMIIVIE